MASLLYRELVPWYHLVDPPEDHRAEAASYEAALERGMSGNGTTLLELGAGAGNNAVHLKRRFQCTLSDLSPEMLALSRRQNPECEHVLGDMRTLRLGRTFDAVLIHDAVAYMTTEADLSAAIRTAFEHTRPGGAAVIAPDYLRETFRAGTTLLAEDELGGARGLRGLEWVWDPDEADQTYRAEYAFLLREGDDVQVHHDRHVEGLFDRATWHRLLSEAGYLSEMVPRPLDDEGVFDEVFLCMRR